MDVNPLDAVLRHFAELDDPRRHNVVYRLPQLLTLTLMAALAGADDYDQVADWVGHRLDWLREAKADYLLAVKDNQKSLREDIELFFDDAIKQQDSQLLTHTAEPDSSHGRLDERTTWATEQIDWLRQRHPDWTDLKGIVCVEGKRLDFATGRQSVERRYYLTSLDPWKAGPAAGRTHPWSLVDREPSALVPGHELRRRPLPRPQRPRPRKPRPDQTPHPGPAQAGRSPG